MKMNDTAKLGAILPAILNPATAVIGIGLGLLWLLSDDDDEEGGDKVNLVTVRETSPNRPAMVMPAAVKPLTSVETQPEEIVLEASEPASPTSMTSEADQNEMIRNAMSELGKRSAAARAKKKAEHVEHS
jgi:hypothetical protein